MYMVSKKLKKKYNITDERAALYDAAETWTKALEGKEFLGVSCSVGNYWRLFFIIYFLRNNLCYFHLSRWLQAKLS